MRIPNNTFSNTLVAQLQQLTARQSDAQNQIATGQRMTHPSDDPAATARVLEYAAEKQQLQQFSRNNSRATNISESSFAAVKELKDISDRAGEIVVLGSGTAGPDALRAYGAEADQMLEQALQTANTKYAGEHLFGGTKSNSPPFTAVRDASGRITSVSYSGASAGAEIRTSEGAKISPFTSGAKNQKFADFLNNLAGLRDALQSGNANTVQGTHAALQSSEDDFIVTLSEIGAKQTRLESDRTQNEVRFAELEKLTGKETDADITEAVVKLTQAHTTYQAALQSGAKMLSMSLLDYIR